MVRVGSWSTNAMMGLVGGLALVMGCNGGGVSSSASALGDEDDDAMEGEGIPDLDKARAATARYHRVEVAEAEGFVRVSDCVESPAGVMGIHYLNLGRLDASLDVAEPELLLYVPKENGGLRLVGIEYMRPILHQGQPWVDAAPPDPADVPPTPSLFGQSFNGPMAGHAPGEPWHFDLHVWLWRENPSGMFAQFNPELSCTPPGEDQGEEDGEDGVPGDDEDERAP